MMKASCLVAALLLLTWPPPLNDQTALRQRLQTAIDHYLLEQRLCIHDAMLVFPRTVEQRRFQENDFLSFFYEIGFIYREEKPAGGRHLNRLGDRYYYSLSPYGEQHYRLMLNEDDSEIHGAFCYGSARVVAIEQVQEVQVEQGWRYRVYFSYSIKQVDSWARIRRILRRFHRVERLMRSREEPLDAMIELDRASLEWIGGDRFP